MGERLVFKCIKNGEMFATLYYHWSGYTESVYHEAIELIRGLRMHNYNKDITTDDLKKLLLKILEAKHCDETGCHGGVSYTPEEVEAFRNLGVEPKVDDLLSRNEGLIDITKEGMKNSIFWGEAINIFDFDDETFTNYGFYTVPEEDLEDYDIPKDLRKIDIPTKFTDHIKWGDAEDALRWYDAVTKNSTGGVLGIDSHGSLIGVIA